MLPAPYVKACDTIFSLLEFEELSGKVDTPLTIFFLVLWTPTSLFEEVLVGSVPVGNAVTKDHTRTVKEPRGLSFAFKVRVGLIDSRVFLSLFAIECLSAFFFLPCLGIPYIACASHPLAEYSPLFLGGIGFKAYS